MEKNSGSINELLELGTREDGIIENKTKIEILPVQLSIAAKIIPRKVLKSEEFPRNRKTPLKASKLLVGGSYRVEKTHVEDRNLSMDIELDGCLMKSNDFGDGSETNCEEQGNKEGTVSDTPVRAILADDNKNENGQVDFRTPKIRSAQFMGKNLGSSNELLEMSNALAVQRVEKMGMEWNSLPMWSGMKGTSNRSVRLEERNSGSTNELFEVGIDKETKLDRKIISKTVYKSPYGHMRSVPERIKTFMVYHAVKSRKFKRSLLKCSL